MARTTKLSMVAGMIAVLTAGCELFDPERPVLQPDTIVYGNLLEVQEASGDARRVVEVRIGVPRALSQAEVGEGGPTPEVEPGLMAEVTVDQDTVVLLGGVPAQLDDFSPGTEVVALPVTGTTRMVGQRRVLLDAGYFLDFESYRAWKLPRLGLVEEAPGDVTRINSPGVEHAPVPVAGGAVLYFAAHLRRPPVSSVPGIGAPRAGLEAGDPAIERPYRAALTANGWSTPEPVLFPGVDDCTVVRVSWVSEDESRALVTVRKDGEPAWVGVATRSGADARWNSLDRWDALGPDEATDGVYLAGSRTKVTFVSQRGGVGGSDLFLYDPKVPRSPLPLEPRINTAGNEYGPRIGPRAELFFTRGDRQLVLVGGEIRQLRLPAPHRVVVTEAALTQDAQWVFFCSPRYRPVELDLDIWVAPWRGDGELGAAVPVDDWRPG